MDRARAAIMLAARAQSSDGRRWRASGVVQRRRRRTALRYAVRMSTPALHESDVRHVAKLSRLRLSDEEVARLSTQLSAILGHISQIRAVDVSDVEPMAHPLPLTNRLDDDVPAPAMPLDDLLRNAPATEGRFLAVPKVLAEGDA